MFETIDCRRAKQLLAQGNVTLIDVREPGEFAASHIQGATLMPLSALAVEQLADQCDQYIIYCQKGGRGKQACEKLLAGNAKLNIVNLEGGIESWQQAGFATQGKGNLLPLDRQVQLTIGGLLILITLLVLIHNPSWVVLAGIIGAGLAVAGITGFCGLARLMAMMPWNQRV